MEFSVTVGSKYISAWQHAWVCTLHWTHQHSIMSLFWIWEKYGGWFCFSPLRVIAISWLLVFWAIWLRTQSQPQWLQTSTDTGGFSFSLPNQLSLSGQRKWWHLACPLSQLTKYAVQTGRVARVGYFWTGWHVFFALLTGTQFKMYMPHVFPPTPPHGCSPVDKYFVLEHS